MHGHTNRGKSNVWKQNPASHNVRTGHERAWKALGEKFVEGKWTTHARARCELDRIGGCRGAIEVHHKDKNAMNNATMNLIVVCRSHHRLLDLGRIDLAAPRMPEFVVDSSGKRRYR